MNKLTTTQPFGNTGLSLPPIVFGTSCLGNLYRALPDETKLDIVREWFEWVAPPVVADTAGKYGAGLALEIMGNGLRELGIDPANVVISNKLGWKRVPLTTPEPTFEPGAWANLEYDAEQHISYDGILDCWEQGCALLGEGHAPQLVSVHDPDEYLAAAANDADRAQRWNDVIGAYRALGELKRDGLVKGVGVGSKDWTVIREIADAADLDWVMFACSLTVYTHPASLTTFMDRLHEAGVAMINSAVFNAGFLIGGDYFDYRIPDPVVDADLFSWRERFLSTCERYEVRPVDACVRFGMTPPGVVSIALNTSNPRRIQENVASVQADIPAAFWTALKDAAVLAVDYPYVG